MNNVFFDKLLWIDTEFSSLNLETAFLLEVAVIVTDSDFNEIEAQDWVIHNHENDLELMKSALIEHNPEKPEFDNITNTYELHEKSGLLDLVEKSKNSLEAVEGALISFVDKHFPGVKPIVAGNSVSFDRAILKNRMPDLYKKLHYRSIDVSSFKLLYLNSGTKPPYEKTATHRAINDIRESIEELKYLI